MTYRIEVLSGLSVFAPGGERLDLPSLSSTQRALLIALAVSPEGLTYEAAWRAGWDVPFLGASEPGTIQAQMSRLRKLLASAGAPIGPRWNRLRERYELAWPDLVVDARAFAEAVASHGLNGDAVVEPSRLDDLIAVLSHWRRVGPLRGVHAEIHDPAIFDELEMSYRTASLQAARTLVRAHAGGQAVDDRQGRLIREALRDLIKDVSYGQTSEDEQAELVRLEQTLTSALRPPAPSATFAHDAYLEAVCRELRFVRMQHSVQASMDDVVLPLDDIYVSLRLGPETSTEIDADRGVELGAREASDPLVASDLLALRSGRAGDAIDFAELVRDRRWSVILGGPGAGKSTVLRWLALRHAEALLAGHERVVVDAAALGLTGDSVDLGPPRLPILVRVAEFAQTLERPSDEAEIMGFLGRQTLADEPLPLDAAQARSLFETWINAGHALVMLDGLDEVQDVDRRHQVAAAVTRFTRHHVRDPVDADAFEPWKSDASSWMPRSASPPAETGGNQILITSRISGYKNAPVRGAFTIAKALELDLFTVKRFCLRWTEAVERRATGSAELDMPAVLRAHEEARALVAEISERPAIRRLAANPLLLTVLSLIYRERRQLPGTRVAAYEEATKALIQRRPQNWDYGQIVAVLGPLALWLHEERPQGSAHVSEVVAILSQSVTRIATDRHDEIVHRFLQDARHQSGLLVETAADHFGFMHSTFGEFLAAQEVTRSPSEFQTWLPSHLRRSRWVEVVLLALASIDRHDPSATDPVLRTILGDEPARPWASYRNAVVAANALVEMSGGSREIVEDVAARLVATGAELRRAAPRHAAEVATALRQLLEARAEQLEQTIADQLATPSNAAFLCDVMTTCSVSSQAWLEAVDHVCRDPSHPKGAPKARTNLALLLTQAGRSVDPTFCPVQEVLDQDLNGVHRMIYELGSFVVRRADSVDPALSGLIRWLIELADSAGDIDRDLVADRVLELLSDARGSDFETLCGLALALARKRTIDWLSARLLAGSGINIMSAARHVPEPVLLALGARGHGLTSLPEDVQAAMLSNGSAAVRERVLPLAWAAIERQAPFMDHAIAMLGEHVTATGGLPLTPMAIDALEALGSRADRHSRQLLEVLLSRLSVKEQSTHVSRRLHVWLEDANGRPVLARAAACLLALRSDWPLTVQTYDLIAAVIAAEHSPVRPVAMAAMCLERRMDHVPDAVMERADHHARVQQDAGDAAGSHAHTTFCLHVICDDPQRLLSWVERDADWLGGPFLNERVEKEFVDRAIASGVSGEAALGACTASVRWCSRSGAATVTARQYAVTAETSAGRALAATIIANDAMLAGYEFVLPALVDRLAQVDDAAAAAALRAAAYTATRRKNAAQYDDELAAVAHRLVFSRSSATPRAHRAGAALAFAVTRSGSAESALKAFTPWTASASEAVQALHFAVSSIHEWPSNGSLGVEVRIAALAEGLGGMRRGMDALVHTAIECMDPERAQSVYEVNGALLLLDSAAAAHPATFLASASSPDLRAGLLRQVHNTRSHTARGLAFSLLGRFPIVDDALVEASVRAARDFQEMRDLSYARLSGFRPHRDEVTATGVERLIDLLLTSSESNVVFSATLVLASLSRTRTPSSPEAGEARRERVIDALTQLIESKPLVLTFTRTDNGRDLGSRITEILLDVLDDEPVIEDTNHFGLDAQRARRQRAKTGALWWTPAARSGKSTDAPRPKRSEVSDDHWW